MLGNLNQELDKLRQNIGKSLSNVKTESLTTVDVTANKLKEGIALRTNSDVGVSAVINDYKDTIVSKLNGVVGQLSSGLLNVSNITKTIKIENGTVTFDTKDLMAAVEADLGLNLRGSIGVVKKLSEDIMGEFDRVSNLIKGNSVAQLFLEDGEGFRINPNWRDKLGQRVLTDVIKFTDIDKFLDTTVITSVRNTVFKNAVEFGMSDSFKDIFDSYPKGFEFFTRDIVIEATNLAVELGDLISVNKLTELLVPEAKNTLLSKNPNLVENIFTNFKFDQQSTNKEDKELLPTLKDTLNTLVGDDWYLKDSAFGKVYDMNTTHSASDDMKSLLNEWEEIGPLLATSDMFIDEEGKALLLSTFPSAPRYDF